MQRRSRTSPLLEASKVHLLLVILTSGTTPISLVGVFSLWPIHPCSMAHGQCSLPGNSSQCARRRSAITDCRILIAVASVLHKPLIARNKEPVHDSRNRSMFYQASRENHQQHTRDMRLEMKILMECTSHMNRFGKRGTHEPQQT